YCVGTPSGGGHGGKNIRRIQEETGAEVEVGKIYKGHVVSIKEFGAFIEIFPGKEGLLHVSQIDVKRVNRVEDVLKMGDEVEVKCLEIDENGKIRLSRKAVLSPGSENDSPGPRRDGPPREHSGGPRRGGSGGGGRR
ncbi:MAG: S1 RNA-binding domain-containing protein, partial [Elusimicrobiota bacterium]